MKKYFLGLLALTTLSALADEVADNCKVTIEGSDHMSYNTSVISIDKKTCDEFTIELKHAGNLPATAMGHNVVIAAAEDVEGVVTDGISAGLDNDYVKPEDSRVIAHTKLVGGGDTVSVSFKTDSLKPGIDYRFFCTFPGHYSMMNGKIEVAE